MVPPLCTLLFFVIAAATVCATTSSPTPPRRRVLASDGIDTRGQRMLEQAGFDVLCPSLPSTTPETLPDYDVLVVRSKTKVTRALLSQCTPSNPRNRLRLIARAGVGLDNIDLAAAADHNIAVVNTPNANARSVAELVFAHVFSLARSLHVCHKEMPANADRQARAIAVVVFVPVFLPPRVSL